MAYADALRSTTCNMNDVATLIEGIGVSGYPLVWANWSPTYGAGGSGTFTIVTTSVARYVRIGRLVHCQIDATGTIGGTPNHAISYTLPVSLYGLFVGSGIIVQAGYGAASLSSNSSTAGGAQYYNLSTLTAGSLHFYGSFTYEAL